MRRHIVAVVAAVTAVLLVAPSIGGAQARAKRDPREMSADLLRVPTSRAARAAAARADASADAAALAGTGDADSFGRNLIYLGVAQTQNVALLTDCAAALPEDRCIPVAPGPEMTFFDEADLARIQLPAKATNSLLCYTLTPFMNFEFWNGTGATVWGANFTGRAVITIENAVLSDPTLVDPMTGEPYGGKIVMALGTYNESRSLGVDEYAYKRLTLTRSCIGGMLSKSALVDVYGLTTSQAAEFFKNPMTFRFGASGFASYVDFANYFYGIRLYGD